MSRPAHAHRLQLTPGTGFNRLDGEARARLIGRLKGTIDRLAGDVPCLAPATVASRSDQPGWHTGLAAIDARLPAGGLETHALHEVVANAYGDAPAALGFAAALAGRHMAGLKRADTRPVLWVRALGDVSEYGRLYAHGLGRFGLGHERLLSVSLRKPAAVLWTIEEALRSGAVSMVVCDADHGHFDLTATRRAMLAAQEGATPCLLVFARPRDGATAARTRWQVSPAPSIPPPYDETAPGNPAWHLELTRSRGGKPGAWTVDWHHATYRFSLVSQPVHRAAETVAEGKGPVEPAARGAHTVCAGDAGGKGT